VLNNGAFNVPTTTDGDTVTAGVQPLNIGAGDGGWHNFELRLGQGTGGVGAPGNQGGANWPFGTFGFGYNANPPATIPNAIQQSNYQPLVDNGSGTLLRSVINPGAGDIQVDAGVTMNLGAYRDHDSVSVSGRLNLTPNGTNAGTSSSQSLTTPGTGVIDIANNDLIVRSTAATKDAEHAAIQADIVSGQNGVDAALITKWDGPGIISTTARTTNLGQGFDLTAVGVIRNSDLNTTIPGSAYTTFDGQTVSVDDILVKYTYTGDANLSGAVTFDDYVGMDNAFFGLIPNLGWATGDINFDGVINFDDYSKVDQAFFFQGAPLAGESGVAAVPEPGTWLFAALASLAGLITWFRRR
jgi:PEP-CTERM motif-containing protein